MIKIQSFGQLLIRKLLILQNFCLTTFTRQSIHAHKGLLKRLESRSAVEAFDAEIQDGVSRGVWPPADEEDLKYSGPINYIGLTAPTSRPRAPPLLSVYV